MTAAREPRYVVDGTPWARSALARDPERTAELGARARVLRAGVGVIGKTVAGPWVVRVGQGGRVLTFRGSDVHDTVAFGLDRWEAGADDTGILWIAAADRLAHGHAPRMPWTLCHQRAIDERMAHPELRRCNACWLALDNHPDVAARRAS